MIAVTGSPIVRLNHAVAVGLAEARTEFERASAMATNARERELLHARALAAGAQDTRIDGL